MVCARADFADWFGAYAARVAAALGDRVRYWITINEPNAFLFGYLKPFWLDQYAWPPGLPAEATTPRACGPPPR